MKINLTSVLVDDQDKALTFYTDVLGFVKKNEISLGKFKWLTVVSPEGPNDIELLLEPNENPAAKTFQAAIFQQGTIGAEFFNFYCLFFINNLKYVQLQIKQSCNLFSKCFQHILKCFTLSNEPAWIWLKMVRTVESFLRFAWSTHDIIVWSFSSVGKNQSAKKALKGSKAKPESIHQILTSPHSIFTTLLNHH